MPKIKHVVVLMMENHTFDNVLGLVGYEEPARRGTVDGLTLGKHGKPTNFNRDNDGRKVFADYTESPCQRSGVPTQSWNASHQSYADGANSGFVKASGPVAMRFFDKQRLPFTASLAAHFPIGQRYFSSVLAQTYPNRRFLFTGTASGPPPPTTVTFSVPAANGTIFDRLNTYGISWANYFQNLPSALIVPGFATAAVGKTFTMDQFYADVAAGKLPQFTFLDPQYTTTSEENPQDIQVGERFVASVVKALIKSPTWEQHRAVHQLRRGRRLLRPRPAAEGDQARPRSRRSRSRATFPASTTATGSGFRCSSSPRGRRPATSRTSSRTTPRCWPSSSASGTCRR